MANTSFKNDLGKYQGRQYFVLLEGSPDLADPDEFAAVLFYPDADRDTHVQIARIDTSHGDVHFDRLYRRGEPKDTEVDFGPWEAFEQLAENWRTYAKSFASK
jgi:hypothetical protein